jgi:purine-nucleoside phosphorylase
MSEPFDPAAGAMLRKAAAREKVALKDGVYAAVAGPNYETRAEIEMLRRLGADAVGMSTVPEAIAARHAGVRLAGISTIANLPYRGAGGPTTHEEVLAVAEKARAGLTRLLFAALPRLAMLVESPVFGREI